MSKSNLLYKLIAALILLVACSGALHSQTLTTLYSFHGQGGTDGNTPNSSLVQGADGNLYGVTSGNVSGCCWTGAFGTVFRITPTGSLTTLYIFSCTHENQYCPDGADPNGPLLQAPDGNFYGTTSAGGSRNNNCVDQGLSCGIAFKMTPDGKATRLHNFCQTPCQDGGAPNGGFIFAPDGNLYGTATTLGEYGGGNVFKMTLGGAVTPLASFRRKVGVNPNAPLVLATNGVFYGTTLLGGINKCDDVGRCGTVFGVRPDGTLKPIHEFCSAGYPTCPDGFYPNSSLIQAADGSLYGTTPSGGATESGTIFMITSGNQFTTIYTFCTQKPCVDGSNPESGVVQGTDGNFYGTTWIGGAYGAGSIFQFTPSGKLITLYSFCAGNPQPCPDGSEVYGGLVQGTDGNFYGTTEYGGSDTVDCGDGGCGTIYKFSMGLPPFVRTNPGFGIVGGKIGILGTDLTGASSVTFNGVAAAFTVKSTTFIVATVPSGATTGKIQVVTPNATLSSNVPFIVLH